MSQNSANIDNADHCSSWVGIDLGTTNSCVAVWRNGKVEIIANSEGSNLTPSCVSFLPNEPEPVVGECAKLKRFTNPESTIFEMKRLFGLNFNDKFVEVIKGRWAFNVVDDGFGKPVVELEMPDGTKRRQRPLDIQSLVLRKMRETAERHLGHPVKKAVISIPAYFDNEAKAETLEAARLAGFEDDCVDTIHEPTAAAYFYGFNAQKYNDQRLLVFDLGGGTFDVTILDVRNTVFTEIGIDGIRKLGGQDFDSEMFDLAVKKFRQKYGITRDVLRDKGTGPYIWEQCQEKKKRLSTSNKVQLNASIVLANLEGGIQITKKEYEECIRPLVEDAMKCVRNLLKLKKLQPKDIDVVLLVGGSTRMPIIRDMLKNIFANVHLDESVNADEAVCMGAAIYAAKHCQNVREGIPYIMSIIEATPLKLGASGKDGICYTLIDRNTPLPATESMRFVVKHVSESEVTTSVRIYEGERVLEQGNRVLGTLVLKGLRPNDNGKIVNMLKFELDKNGILTATYWNTLDCRNEDKKVFDYRRLQSNREDTERRLEEAEQNRIVDQIDYKRLKARHELEEAIEEVRFYESRNKNKMQKCSQMLEWMAQNTNAKSTTYKAKMRKFKHETANYSMAAQLNPFSSESEEDDDFEDDFEENEGNNREREVTKNVVGVDRMHFDGEDEEILEGENGRKKQRIG